jgi:hypothetical protein
MSSRVPLRQLRAASVMPQPEIAQRLGINRRRVQKTPGVEVLPDMLALVPRQLLDRVAVLRVERLTDHLHDRIRVAVGELAPRLATVAPERARELGERVVTAGAEAFSDSDPRGDRGACGPAAVPVRQLAHDHARGQPVPLPGSSPTLAWRPRCR